MAIKVHEFVTSALDVCAISFIICQSLTFRERAPVPLVQEATKSQGYSGHDEEMKNQHPSLEPSPGHMGCNPSPY